jgi:serine protease Do
MFFDKVKQQKLLSFTLLVFTLSVGIVIGTLANTGVFAAKAQNSAPDATPLVIPPAKQSTNEVAKLAKLLEPSVVHISTDYIPKQAPSTRKGRPAPGPEDEEDEDAMDLFRRFFPNGGGQGGPANPRAFRREATGSGFVVDKNGYIITNHHVVDKADHIKVKLPHDPTEYRARLIGSDVETDLAIIKIDATRPLTPLKIGNSDAVQVGDTVVAIGSPFGLEASVTLGIVSATGRDIAGSQQFQRFIQTDAAINPGNSGGPLINMNGELIGINTAIATQSGGYQGIGFALPVNTAVNVYNSIIKTGKVARGSIGIQFNNQFARLERSSELLKALGLKGGVLVESVNPGGPAEKAGLKADDVIIAFNGQPVRDGDDLVNRVSTSPIGSQQNVTVDRGGKKLDLKVTIGDREAQLAALTGAGAPAAPGEATEEGTKVDGAKGAKFGISIRALNDTEREGAGIAGKGGVVVAQVQEGSFADEIGLQDRDIITSINRQEVSSVEDVRRIQGNLKVGDPVAFRVYRPNPFAGRPGARTGQPAYQGLWLSGTLQNQ